MSKSTSWQMSTSRPMLEDICEPAVELIVPRAGEVSDDVMNYANAQVASSSSPMTSIDAEGIVVPTSCWTLLLTHIEQI